MKVSLRFLLVFVAICGLAFTLVGRMRALNSLQQRWTKIGGDVTKDVFPVFGWNYVTLRATSQSHERQTFELVNSLILQVTNQPNCKQLRLERGIVESLKLEVSDDVDTLNRLLAGVFIDKVELIDWKIDSASVQTDLVGMHVKHWELRYSSSFK